MADNRNLASLDKMIETMRIKFAASIKNAREANGYSLTDVEAMTGVKKDHLWQIEAGKKNPTPPTLLKLSYALNIDFNISASSGVNVTQSAPQLVPT